MRHMNGRTQTDCVCKPDGEKNIGEGEVTGGLRKLRYEKL